MKMDDKILNELCQNAITAARQAGEIIAEHMHKKIIPQRKLSGTGPASQVVTEVDFMSQEAILNVLSPTCDKYDLGLLAEEDDDSLSRLEKDYFWCIDPMDGTLSFVEGAPGFSVSIALVSKSGESQIGVVYDPLENNLYSAIKGKGAFKNNKPWKCASVAGDDLCRNSKIKVFLDRGMVHYNLFDSITDELNRFAAENRIFGVEFVKYGGSVMNACRVLENPPACYFKFPKKEKGGGSLWDFAATSCLFPECGAVACDIYGEALDLNRKDSTYMNHKGILFASSNDIAQLIMDLHKKISI
jgi:fructose-1,6-bisphosphatase/inositol monophosphatase family enzyme